MRIRLTDLLLLTITCGVVGALLDQIHVQSGTLSYAHPALLDQAWWVVPQFAVLLVLVVLTTMPLVRADAPAPTMRRLATDTAWFIAAYLVSGIPAGPASHDDATIRGLVLLVLTTNAITRLVLRRDRAAWLVAVSLTIGGPAYEAIVSSTGGFSYVDRDIAGVPMWLPALYATGAPLAVSVAVWLRSRTRACARASD